MKIKNIVGREILDSRGNPTVEVDVILENGILGRASVPSGASTGSREALELRDNDDRYKGLGVMTAVNNINFIIRENLVGMDVLNQRKIDEKLIDLDGTDNKYYLGANAILGVSLAVLKAGAICKNKKLYEYVGSEKDLPIPMINIVNGGVHADNKLDFQEFMIIPNRDTIKERIRISSEVFHSLKKVLKINGYNTNVGDEGGFAPNIGSNSEAIELIIEAVDDAGYKMGKDFYLAIDVAANELYKDGYYFIDGKKMNIDELIMYYNNLIDLYPIVSIEDPVIESDYESFKKVTDELGNKVQLVGDDLFVTNKKYLGVGILKGCGNAILIKPNQIGTISEMLDTIEMARSNNYTIIISHRSGETEDVSIANLAVGLGIKYIKCGSMSRTDRICKYNELIRIEEELYGR